MLLCIVCACLLATVHTGSVGRLVRRQTNFGGGGDRQGGQAGQGGQAVQEGQAGQPSTDTRFLFGANGLLGNLFGGNDCACVTDGRRRRQAEVDTKFFFGGGNSGCNCPSPSSSEDFVNDCKGRPQGDTFYGCGCSGGQGGGLFGFGRKRRQTSQKENVNTKFLDFRCIGATILGRKAK